jgi:hypothetical protein
LNTQLLNVYADTSVVGGAFDEEFDKASQSFFDMVRQGLLNLLTSVVVQEEIESAPAEVVALFEEMLNFAEIVEVSQDALQLQRAYLDADIVTEKWAADALHVALATVGGCSVIVSWNFKHIVHFSKIPRYNAVNTLSGYSNIAIHSPQEVINYEDEEDI